MALLRGFLAMTNEKPALEPVWVLCVFGMGSCRVLPRLSNYFKYNFPTAAHPAVG